MSILAFLDRFQPSTLRDRKRVIDATSIPATLKLLNMSCFKVMLHGKFATRNFCPAQRSNVGTMLQQCGNDVLR